MAANKLLNTTSLIAQAAALLLAMSPAIIIPSSAWAACPTQQPADYSGQTINGFNFGACSEGSLVGANFSSADLSGSTFSGVDLTNANFNGASLGPTETYPAVNFNSATLKKTNFTGATTSVGQELVPLFELH